MIRRFVATLATLVLAVAALLVAGSPAASASTSTRLTTDLITTKLPALGEVPKTVLRLSPITMKTGEKRYFYAKIATRSNAPRGPMIGSRILCLTPPGWGGGGGSTYTTRNHDGQRFGIKSVVTRWLFTAPHDGTYNCEVRAWAATLLSPEKVNLTVVPDRTVLRSTPATAASQEWRTTKDSCVGRQRIPSGVPQCRYVTTSKHVLRHGVNVGRANYTNFVGDVELTREYGPYPGGVSKVRTTLYATQLTILRTACATTKKVTTTSTINNDIHHLKVNMTLAGVKRSTGLLCTPRFRVGVAVKHLEGNPVTIHNQYYSNLIALVR